MGHSIYIYFQVLTFQINWPKKTLPHYFGSSVQNTTPSKMGF